MSKLPSLSGVLRQFYVQHWGLLLTGLLLLLLLFQLWSMLAPFVAALSLAYLLNTPSRWMYKKLKGRVPLSVCSVSVFLGLIVLLAGFGLLLIPVVSTQLDLIENNLPQFLVSLKTALLPWLHERLGWSWALDGDQVSQRVALLLKENRAFLAEISSMVVQFGSQSVLGFTGFVSLMFMATLFILPSWLRLSASIRLLFPPRVWVSMSPVLQEVDGVLSDYLKGMFSLVLCQGIFYSVSLSLIGLQSGWAIGILAGLLCVVPYLGLLVSMVLAVLTAALELQGLWPVVWVLVVFGIGQVLEGFVFTPWLVGDKIGLSAIAVMFALAFFGAMFGLVGVVLALPLAAIFKVGYVHLFRVYVASHFYRG